MDPVRQNPIWLTCKPLQRMCNNKMLYITTKRSSLLMFPLTPDQLKLVSVLVENPNQNHIQTPGATIKQGGKLGWRLFYLLFTVIIWSLNFGDFKITKWFDFFLDLVKSNHKFLKWFRISSNHQKFDSNHDFKIIKSNHQLWPGLNFWPGELTQSVW